MNTQCLPRQPDPRRSGLSTARPRPVLVAVGHDDLDDAHLRFACDEALRCGCPLRLVHVHDRPGLPMDDRQVRRAAARAADLSGGTVQADTLMPEGPVIRVLAELSREVDRVVLLRRRRSRLERLISGSVSTRVAGSAHASTVSVPEGWQPCHPVPPRLTVGVDEPDDDSAELVRHACARAADLGVGLTVLHAWQLPTGYDDAVVDEGVVRDWRDRYTRALNSRLAGFGQEHPDVPVTIQVVHQDPAAALIAAGRSSQAVLVGRGRLAHPLVANLGSVTREVLHDAECPVEVWPGGVGDDAA